jgi:hypothetical protein
MKKKLQDVSGLYLQTNVFDGVGCPQQKRSTCFGGGVHCTLPRKAFWKLRPVGFALWANDRANDFTGGGPIERQKAFN